MSRWFLHGSTDALLTWARVAPAVQDSHRLLMLDTRGHGDSDRAPDGYDLVDSHVADVKALCDSELDRSAVLVGHSHGGVTAAAMAARHPGLVRAVVLLDPPLWGRFPAELTAYLETLEGVLAATASADDPHDVMVSMLAQAPAFSGNGSMAEALAETLHARGVVRRSFGDTAQGSADVDEARALYASVGMDHRVQLIDDAMPPAGAAAAPGPGPGNAFRREGDYWTLAYQGRTVRMADAKGLHDIATLLGRPGREFHVADLIAATDPATGERDECERTQLLRGGASSEPVLDNRARAAYRDRLPELRDDIEEAEANADLGRAEAARVEMDLIAGELAADLGIGGRPRPQADAGERARKAVTQRIRNSLKRIATVHPELANHLERSLRTGRFCSYSPEQPTEWSL